MEKEKKQTQKYIWIIIGVAVLALLVVVGLVGYVAYDNLQDRLEDSIQENETNQRLLEESLTDAQRQAEEAEEAAEILEEKNSDLAKDLEDVKDNAASQIEKLENQIVSSASDEDSSELVSEWEGRVGYIVCSDGVYEWSGSGTAFLDSAGGAYVMTNYHVVEDAYACDVYFPGDDYYYPVDYDSIFWDDSPYDWALLYIGTPSRQLSASLFPEDTCYPSDMSIGDDIVVLGYPGNGASATITVTEGIISGFDEDYIVTDAKIDHGNSGGAALLASSGCYLGIPTASVAGQLESLGRILDFNVIAGY